MSIYPASKVKHADLWKKLRDDGYPVKASWLDLAGSNQIKDWSEHWDTCISEATSADVLILYAAFGDNMKGAISEATAALLAGVPVFVVAGREEVGFIALSNKVRVFDILEDALAAAKEVVGRS